MSTTIHERTTRIKTGSVNSYLVGTEKGFVLIDTGTAGSFSDFQRVFGDHKITFTDLIAIILTHTHYDHTGNAKAIRERSSAPIIVHAMAEEYVKQGYTPLPKGTKPFGKLMIKLAGAAKSHRGSYPPFTPDITVTDRYDLTQLGVNGEVISTPGHTKASMTIILEDDACFVGDSIFNFGFSSFYPPFADDKQALLTTWDFFKNLPCSVFYPGHGKPIKKPEFLENFEKIIRKHRST